MPKKKKYATHVTLPSGERVYVSAPTKAELEARVLKLKMEMAQGVDVGDATTFREYAAAWLHAYKKPRLRENSYQTVVANLENHVVPYFGDMRLRDIKPLHVQMFLAKIRPLSRSTQSKCFQIFKGIMRTAAENGLIVRSPVTKEDRVGGETAEEAEPLTAEQARRLLDSVAGTRAYTFCFLALATGLRRGEILGLMWDDLDLETGKLNVRHNKTFPANANDAPVTTLLKSEAARRTVPMSEGLRAYLEQERKRSSSPYVLSMENGESLSKSSFRKLWDIVTVRTVTEDRPLGTVVGGSKTGSFTVDLDFDCHPHLLRHTCITHWVESGMDFKEVQYLAGHSTLEMTLKVYTHYRRKSREAETAERVKSATAYLSV